MTIDKMKKYLYQIDMQSQDAPAKLLRGVGHGKRVLEVGCASGTQSRILKEELACTVTGIEINPLSAAEATQHCERVIVGNLETLNLAAEIGDNRYDVITIADVLEHLADPQRALEKLRPFLDIDGCVIASIPNVVHTALILEMARGRFDYRPYGLLDDTHIRFFTLKSILRTFENAGFDVCEIDRSTKSVEETEFFNHELSDEERRLIDFIQSSNSEASTYQFIVTAKVKSSPTKSQTFGELEALDRLKDADASTTVLRKRVRALESRINWIETRPTYRLLTSLKRLFEFGRGTQHSPTSR